jgi:hypothetical protein
MDLTTVTAKDAEIKRLVEEVRPRVLEERAMVEEARPREAECTHEIR